MTKWFPPEFRTASVVPRWSIVWTLTRDTLANHSFFVDLYARQIGKMIEWNGDYGDLSFMAKAHDLDETITGDIVAPAKHAIVDNDRARTYVREQMTKRLGTIVEQENEICARLTPIQISEIKRIVKAADRLDALLFLVIEQRMGNGVIGPLIPQVQIGLIESWSALPYPPGRSGLIAHLWETVVEPAIKEHAMNGGFGV